MIWRLFINGWRGKWKWWMRWLPVSGVFVDSGCHDDSHDDESCPCNDFLEKRRMVESDGFIAVAFHPCGLIFCDGRTLIRNYHRWGR